MITLDASKLYICSPSRDVQRDLFTTALSNCCLLPAGQASYVQGNVCLSWIRPRLFNHHFPQERGEILTFLENPTQVDLDPIECLALRLTFLDETAASSELISFYAPCEWTLTLFEPVSHNFHFVKYGQLTGQNQGQLAQCKSEDHPSQHIGQSENFHAIPVYDSPGPYLVLRF
jgi:hypothetical protein